MKLHLDPSGSANVIRAYETGRITVNDEIIEHSVVVMPDQLNRDWPPQSFAELSADHFEPIADYAPEILLMGTGSRQRFPDPRLLSVIIGRGIGYEVMDTGAACRTYNILCGEGRRVAAALLMI